MYESALAENAYAYSAQHTSTPRGIEYKLFARVTRDLEAMKREKKSTPDRIAKLAKALNDNERLWKALAVDVAMEGNGLPAELRSKIFYLFEFTRQHSRKVLQGEAAVDVLVDINTAVMRGVKGEQGAQGA